MSVIGSPIETSTLQAIQAQQVAGKARDREKAQSATGRRFADLVELRTSGVETIDAVRKLPRNDSPEAQAERKGRERDGRGADHGAENDPAKEARRIDIQA